MLLDTHCHPSGFLNLNLYHKYKLLKLNFIYKILYPKCYNNNNKFICPKYYKILCVSLHVYLLNICLQMRVLGIWFYNEEKHFKCYKLVDNIHCNNDTQENSVFYQLNPFFCANKNALLV